MALLQKALAYYYPQCSGMPSLVDGNDNDSGSVTPLKYVPNCNSRIPSVTDLTGLSTVARNDSSKSTAAAKVKPRRSTAAGAKVKPPPRSTAAFQDDHSDTTTTAMIHPAATDLLTSTVILMPEANESENNHVDSIQAVV